MAIYNAYNMAFIYGNIYGYICVIYTDVLTFSLVNDWYKHYKWYEISYGNRSFQDYTVHDSLQYL